MRRTIEGTVYVSTGHRVAAPMSTYTPKSNLKPQGQYNLVPAMWLLVQGTEGPCTSSTRTHNLRTVCCTRSAVPGRGLHLFARELRRLRYKGGVPARLDLVPIACARRAAPWSRRRQATAARHVTLEAGHVTVQTTATSQYKARAQQGTKRSRHSTERGHVTVQSAVTSQAWPVTSQARPHLLCLLRWQPPVQLFEQRVTPGLKKEEQKRPISFQKQTSKEEKEKVVGSRASARSRARKE
eukprot:3755210-Rhodomonas_salina.1